MKKVAEKAKLIAESIRQMGYDAVAVGDDDLSLGKEFLMEISKETKVPFLSSNLLDEATGKPLFPTSLIKNSSGLRIGIFSLLGPDTFPNPNDPRRKGLLLRPPAEVAQAMVKELQPKTDWIILLSHLGYPKDVELAQALPGIQIIIGGHTGINLANPPIINKSLILQMASKGLYGGILSLTLFNNDPHFFNTLEKRSMEVSLHQLKDRISFSQVTEIETWLQSNLGPLSRMLHLFRLYQVPFPEEFIQNMRNLIASLKAKGPEKENPLRRKIKEEAEQILQQFQGRNGFIHRLIALGDQIQGHPEIEKMVEAYRVKYPEPEQPPPPRQEAPRFQKGAPQN